MKRPMALLLGLLTLPLVGLAPAAEAQGGAVCTISGTINFVQVSSSPERGTWSIEPAVISCQGVFRAAQRITGPGAFTGSGTYTETPAGTGTCLHHVGTGKVDYILPTSDADVHMKEPHDFVLAGAGVFTTPSLTGSFLVTPPYVGNCLMKPLTKATFVAQALLVRTSGLEP